MINFDNLKIPDVFECGKSQEAFWDEAYISKQMLAAHLNPSIDAASRKKVTIEKTCDFLFKRFDLDNKEVVDLGCGPGLYTTELRQKGAVVTGVDYSKNSIEYARSQDKEVTYVYQDYLALDLNKTFDFAMMIYCDFGVLSYENRATLLNRVHQHLKPEGYFIFDVWTNQNKDLTDEFKEWSVVEEEGFWRPHKYVYLINKMFFRESQVSLKQHIILDDQQQVYNMWEQCYSKESIKALLEAHDFEVVEILCDVTGKAFTADSNTMGIVAKKRGV